MNIRSISNYNNMFGWFKLNTLIILLFPINLFCKDLDKLLLLLNNEKSDSGQVNLQADISWEYRLKGDYLKAMQFGHSALDKAIKIKFNSGIAKSYNALGAICDERGEYPQSLDYYTRALKIHETMNNESMICMDLNNIGLLYENLSNYETALNYYNKALTIALRLNNRRTLSALYFNLGAVYTYLCDYKRSNQFYLMSLAIDQELNDKMAISDCYTNIGINYTYQNMYDTALVYCAKGLRMKELLDDKNGMAAGYINIAEIYSKKYDNLRYKENLIKGLKISQEIGSLDNMRLAYEGLASLSFEMKEYKDAYLFHVLFKNLTDSVFNSQNNEQLNQTKINYEIDKKQAEHERKEAIAIEDKKRKNLVIVGVLLLLVVVSFFSIFLYKRIKITTAQKQIISLQKELVEEKQKEITDSINYAKRIQSSFLSTDQDFKANLKEHFILFKPKDVVSGDFYWASRVGSKFYLCVADSTGHGIPGAFMSLLNISLLNEAVLSKNLVFPSEILNFVRRILILGLKQDEFGQGGNDGMDCVLISIDLNTKELQFSGANNPLWIVREGKLIELKADKMPVGRSPNQDRSFNTVVFALQEGDRIYGFTDGYADQFGGPTRSEGGKKFKYKRLEEIIQSNSGKEMVLQKQLLEKAYNEWRGELEQIDDVCIVGVRI